jgi:hypothetical protein
MVCEVEGGRLLLDLFISMAFDWDWTGRLGHFFALIGL